jgi:DNA end-binding protein Ku
VPDIDAMDDGQDPVTRSFWSGTITFGLVSIPVALYAANRSTGVSLRMVAPDGTRLGRRYFTTKDDRELDPDEIVRGYEIEKGRFVLVDDDELERLAPERTRDIDLRQFVKVSDIDPMYFERAYYLIPNGQSTKAYRLLAQVMEDTGRAGIATFVMRAREYLVAIIAENAILRAETLRFADELRTPATIGLPKPAEPAAAAVRKLDREIAKRTDKSFGKEDLADHSVDRLMKVVQRKLRAGDDVVPAEETGGEERETNVIDLMEILKRRLQGESEAEIAADEDEAPRTARKPAARKTAAKKTASKRAAAKTAAKKPASKATASKTAASKKSAAKKATAKKTAAKKATAKKTASKRAA